MLGFGRVESWVSSTLRFLVNPMFEVGAGGAGGEELLEEMGAPKYYMGYVVCRMV
jgi:hypothetical protein